jgi:BirA family biotin operon repressor/biotin-[acetyl-CoA-carboxylase] ligase
VSETRPALNLDLLDLLYKRGGQGVGIGDLKIALGRSQEEIYADVDGLRAAGYVIGRTHPYGSTAYQLLEVPDRLYGHEVRRRIGTQSPICQWLGREVRWEESCASTNDLAREMAAAGAPHGSLAVTEEQTAGRGRLGRAWHSPRSKGLYLSVLLRPSGPFDTAPALPIATGVALAQTAMKITGKPATIRWPNDVLMGGRKLAGILAEAHDPGTDQAHWIVGIGFNVTHSPGDFPEEFAEEATSLAIETGNPLSRLPVLPTLLGTLEEWYDRLLAGRLDEIGDAWKPLSSLIGKEVVLRRGESEVTGRVKDLSPEKGLLVGHADREEWIPAEHVTHVRPASE